MSTHFLLFTSGLPFKVPFFEEQQINYDPKKGRAHKPSGPKGEDLYDK
jgi:hypothetical protein